MHRKYLALVSSLVPMGAVGASLLLGSVLTANAAERPIVPQAPVSERLSAIREAVVVVIGPESLSTQFDRNFHLTWGNRWGNWGRRRNWGWGRPRWSNWRNGWPNWNNFWRNW
jgi:hypothetical protein